MNSLAHTVLLSFEALLYAVIQIWLTVLLEHLKILVYSYISSSYMILFALMHSIVVYLSKEILTIANVTFGDIPGSSMDSSYHESKFSSYDDLCRTVLSVSVKNNSVCCIH